MIRFITAEAVPANILKLVNFQMMPMMLKPILIDEDPNQSIYTNTFCQEVFKSYPAYYFKTGYCLPWIGYFIIGDFEIVGVGGFTGEPKNNRIEIAYGTRKEYEGQGVASFACQQLIMISKAHDPNLLITVKTAPEQNASTTILGRNGFAFTRVVQDEGIGDAWEWILMA